MAGGITETGEPYSAFVSIYNIIRLHPEPNKIDYNECECDGFTIMKNSSGVLSCVLCHNGKYLTFFPFFIIVLWAN